MPTPSTFEVHHPESIDTETLWYRTSWDALVPISKGREEFLLRFHDLCLNKLNKPASARSAIVHKKGVAWLFKYCGH